MQRQRDPHPETLTTYELLVNLSVICALLWPSALSSTSVICPTHYTQVLDNTSVPYEVEDGKFPSFETILTLSHLHEV